MSVIAKLSIRKVTTFGTGHQLELGCIAANDMMAAYAESEEDRLFTKYSPWGEIVLNQPASHGLGKAGDIFYAMILAPDEAKHALESWEMDGMFPTAYACCPATCFALTDFGDGQAKRVEFVDMTPRVGGARGIDRLNWKMSVDNPGATNQFRPGVAGYWIAFYPAASFDRDSTIRAAHGG